MYYFQIISALYGYSLDYKIAVIGIKSQETVLALKKKWLRFHSSKLKYTNNKLNFFKNNRINLKPTGRINNQKYVYYGLADFWIRQEHSNNLHTHITRNKVLIHGHDKGIFQDSIPLRFFKIKCVCESKNSD